MKETQFEMFTLFERTPDLVCIVNKEGFFKQVNAAVIQKLGYTAEELYAVPVSTFIHPDDIESTGNKRRKLLQNQPLLNFQNRYINKNGEILWLEWTSIYLPELEIVFAIAKDITTRKKAEILVEENYQKYKRLANHFKSKIEKDRKSFAEELHEEVAQLASVIKLDLEGVRTQSQPGICSSVEHALQTTKMLINKIRNLTYSISPGMVADLGLDEVLKWLSDEFFAATGISCVYESAFDESSLSYEMKLDLFRICQEALLNVMHHAEAGLVNISINQTGDTIKLSISDDGKGFESEISNQTFGLSSMNDRAASIDAAFTIESEISKGTTVTVTIPIRTEQAVTNTGS
jgi:PAS domain S-box-containing protein